MTCSQGQYEDFVKVSIMLICNLPIGFIFLDYLRPKGFADLQRISTFLFVFTRLQCSTTNRFSRSSFLTFSMILISQQVFWTVTINLHYTANYIKFSKTNLYPFEQCTSHDCLYSGHPGSTAAISEPLNPLPLSAGFFLSPLIFFRSYTCTGMDILCRFELRILFTKF